MQFVVKLAKRFVRRSAGFEKVILGKEPAFVHMRTTYKMQGLKEISILFIYTYLMSTISTPWALGSIDGDQRHPHYVKCN